MIANHQIHGRLITLQTATDDGRGQVVLDGYRQQRHAPLRRHQRNRHGEIVDLETRRDLDARSLEIPVDGAAQHAGDLGDPDEGFTDKMTRIEGLARRKPMIARQDRDERLFRHQLIYEVGIRFRTKKSDIDLSARQIGGERGRKPARNPDFDIGQFVAQDAGRARQPRNLLPGQEADGKDRLRRLRGAARGLRGRRRLRERQPRMVKERASSRG